MLVSATATSFCCEKTELTDSASAGVPIIQNASIKAKEIFLHLPKHDGKTKECHCTKGNEDVSNEKCPAVGFSFQFIVLTIF